MAVKLKEVVFHNNNSLEVQLTVEVRKGKPIEHTVSGNSTFRLEPGIENCTSVLLTVRDETHHGTVQQTFSVSPSTGQPIYIAHLEAYHTVGSIGGTIRARTDGDAKTADEFLRNVEKDEFGQPIFLSRWGWKKIDFDGKTFLVAATRDEALEALRTARMDNPEALVDGCASKDSSNVSCYNTGKCKKNYCKSEIVDTGFRMCVCTN
jgi:hypothetical protein